MDRVDAADVLGGPSRFENASIRFGVLAGLLLSLQLLSCVYYGVFLGMIVAVLILLLAASQPRLARAALVPLSWAAC